MFSDLAELIAELLTSEFGSIEGEAGVLVQVLTSIKSIIKQDPPDHEKVYTCFYLLYGSLEGTC